MTDVEIIFCGFVVWVIGGAFAPLFDEFEHDFPEYIWWPLLLIKTALKGLWSVLFTGWRI